MNKIEFIQKVAKKSGATKKDASIIVNVIANIITKTLANGDILQWKGLGTFKTTARKERMGRNPKTGKPMRIKASRTPSFKAGLALKKAVK